MALMHSSSSEALPTELDLWITYLTQLAQEKSTVQVFNPLVNFDSSNTIELEVPGVGYSYLDLPHMMLYTKQKIVNADGSDITAADNSDATLVNYGFHAQWSQVDVSINGTVISLPFLRLPFLMALMHSSSSEALPTELDLWITYLTQLAQEKSTVQVFNPLVNFDSSNTIELEVPGVGYSYLDLPHMMLYTKQKIVNTDGSDITAADNSDATLVNYGFHAQWSQVDVSINGTVISQSTLTYPYRAFIETELNYDKAAKDTHLQQRRMWYEDSPGHLDSLNGEENLGLAARRSRTRQSRVFEMMGPLHLDLCNVDKLLLNNCSLRIKLTRNRDSFALMSTKASEKIKLLDVKLFVRRVTISPSVLLAHAQALEKSPAKYPVNRIDIKTVTITQGLRDKTIDNLFLNSLPQRVIIGFVDNRAFKDYTRNPFNFQHFNLNYSDACRWRPCTSTASHARLFK
ncbi:hypothetical protein KUF71_015904 [Frankliniella fusca]|uniref:Uncharacterized protein n=1 Tax=Frankliniella fusca TaxID=407009 RepID=A0AAE1LQX5_9NEOP|nr:hypothetical protein KUF71_015904 [Frankliniella fusca]